MAGKQFRWKFIIDGEDKNGTPVLKKVRAEVEGLERAEKKGTETRGKYTKSSDTLFTSLSRLAGPLSLGLLIRQFGKVTAETELMKGQLVTMTGDAERAGLALDKLNSFAETTPFTLDQSVQGFVKLTALGLTPSERALSSYGNTASAMGKDLSQMIEAVADASTFEFERLKEFGIKARQQQDTVSFTFQGVTTTVEKNADAIEGFLTGIGENSFGDAMANQMERIPGMISNLSDAWDNLFRTIADMGGTDIYAGLLQGLSSLIKATSSGIGEMPKLFAALFGTISIHFSNMVATAELNFIALRVAGEEVGGALSTAFEISAAAVETVWTGTINLLSGLYADWIDFVAEGVEKIPGAGKFADDMRRTAINMRKSIEDTGTLSTKIDKILEAGNKASIERTAQANRERDSVGRANQQRIDAATTAVDLAFQETEATEEQQIALEDLAKTRGADASATEEQVTKAGELIASLEEEFALIGATDLEREFANRTREISADLTEEEAARIRELIGALKTEEDSQKSAATAAKDSAKIRQNAIENLQKDQAELIQNWIKEGKVDFDDFYDFVLDGWINTVSQMGAAWLTSGITSGSSFPFFGNGGGSGQSGGSGGGVGGLASSGIMSLLSPRGFVQGASNASFGAANLLESFGLDGLGNSARNQGLDLAMGSKFDVAKNFGLSAVGGIAGNYAGGKIGEGLLGKEAESNIASMILGTAGSIIGGPLGTFIGSTIGSFIDVAAGGDGKKRVNAGFLVNPASSNENTFGVNPFSSGFEPIGFANRADQGTANQIIEQFRNVDLVFTEIAKKFGVDVNLSGANLNGLNQAATPGSSGLFFGAGGDNALSGDIEAQLSNFLRQLIGQISGDLSAEVISAVDAAGNDPIAILDAFAAALAETTDATDKLTDSEKDLADERTASIGSFSSLVTELAKSSDSAQLLKKTLQSDIYGLLGISELRPTLGGNTSEAEISNIRDLRTFLLDQYEEEISRELELHEARAKSYKEQIDLSKSLEQTVSGILSGNLSHLSTKERFDFAMSQFDGIATKAEAGDLEAGKLAGGAGETAIKLIREMFASSSTSKELTQQVIERLVGLQDQFSTAQDPGSFSTPEYLNDRLVRELQVLQDDLVDVQNKIAEEALTALEKINISLQDLPEALAIIIARLLRQGSSGGSTTAPVLASTTPGPTHAIPIGTATPTPAQPNRVLPNTVEATQLPANAIPLEPSTFPSPGEINEFANAVLALPISDNEKTTMFLDQVIAQGVSSQYVATALGMSQTEVLEYARGVGIPAFARGGIVNGPTIAAIGEGGRSEAVIPLPNDFDINNLGGGGESVVTQLVTLNRTAQKQSQQIAALVENLRELKQVTFAAADHSSQQRNEANSQLSDIADNVENSGVGSKKYANQ